MYVTITELFPLYMTANKWQLFFNEPNLQITVRLEKEYTQIKTTNTYTKYKIDNMVHRRDGPAIINKMYSYTSYRWKMNDVYYRENDLPTQIMKFSDGSFIEWWMHDRFYVHRKDLPAIIEYYKEGSIRSQEWYLNNVPYRENNLPILIQYYKNGIIARKKWELRKEKRFDKNGLPIIFNYQLFFDEDGIEFN